MAKCISSGLAVRRCLVLKDLLKNILAKAPCAAGELVHYLVYEYYLIDHFGLYRVHILHSM